MARRLIKEEGLFCGKKINSRLLKMDAVLPDDLDQFLLISVLQWHRLLLF